jgi:hypothetical protein
MIYFLYNLLDTYVLSTKIINFDQLFMQAFYH